MGLFPEDSEIRASRLAMLWIAEGFIPQRESETMEDTANGYLEELVQRSLIQVANRRMYDGGISRCRIHDVMRDMCLAEAKQVGFLNVIHSSSSNGGSVSVSRRLAFLNPSLSEDTENNYSRYLTSNPNLRSMSITEHSTSRYMSLYGLKLLRVLEKTNYISVKMMKEIASMTHLRYLELVDEESRDIIQIPSSIWRFRYLQTLMLGNNFLIKGGQLELPNLRHLFLPNNQECCPSITMSTMLQTLKYIKGNKIWIERNLPRLTNLRRLSMMVNFEDDDANTLYAALGNLHLLASLKLRLWAKDNLSADTILTALAQNHHLFKLVLIAKISERRLPTSSVFPPNLTMLSLFGSKMGEDPMPVLKKLPNLMFLIFSEDAYVGEEIVCTKGGFPRLQELKFDGLSEIQHWIIEDGSFPNLTSLQIFRCEKLTMLPDGLQYVRSLKELDVMDTRREFRDKLRGEDWYKIKDVPSIHIDTYV